MREYNFDGLVGPTHNYAGLSHGNLASMQHGGWSSNPKAAALEGLKKMRAVAALGVGQAVLPPQPRPAVNVLRRFGFSGSDADVLQSAAQQAPTLLARCCSASAMWTANAATVIPSSDLESAAAEGARLHLVPANLASMFHRQIEAPVTTRVLRAIFADEQHFRVHQPLPASSTYGDEGAANHTRLSVEQGVLHVFAWGHSTTRTTAAPSIHPPRQSLEASEAVVRLTGLKSERTLLLQQAPAGIDAGAFHTDVLAVGNGAFLMLHELAFSETESALRQLEERLPGIGYCLASEAELPAAQAVKAYPFNSQLVTLPADADADGREQMALIAPAESREQPQTRRFLERVLAEDNPVARIEYQEVRQSMANGGGPACLRLRVAMTEAEVAALSARVLFTHELDTELTAWVEKHYRDRLSQEDLADPQLLLECHTALDELTQLLELGSVYEFQQLGSDASVS